MNTPNDDSRSAIGKVRRRGSYLSAEAIADMPEETRKHHVDPNAVCNTRPLGDAMGLQRLGVHLVRLQSGRAASEYHVHHHEEEFVYVIAGRGKVEIGEKETELHAGDVVGFPTGELPHRIHNPYPDDLYMLVAGERADLDVCDYPRAGKRLIRCNGKLDYMDIPDDA